MSKKNVRLFLTVAVRLLPAVVLMLPLVGGATLCRAADVPLTLEKAISEAVENNSMIKEAVERQRSAMESEKSARADLLPKLSAEYGYANFKETPYVVFSGMRLDSWKKDRFAWDVQIAQPLFTGFALTTRRKIAELGIRVSEIEKDQAILDVVRDVKIRFFNILLAKRYLEVSEETVGQLEAHVSDARLFFNQELIPENDLLRSQVALAQARQNRTAASGNLDMAVAALNAALAREITANTLVAEVPPGPAESFDLADLFDQAMVRRPELKQLETALAQADLGITMAKSAYYPKVYLTGRYEQVGHNAAASENDFGNSYNTIVGAQAQWQFFEWGKTKADVNKAGYDRKALEIKIEGIRDSIRLEIKSAHEQLNIAHENIRTAEEALGQAKENFRITNLQYQQQVTSSTEVLDAQTFLTQAEMNFYSALYGYMAAQATLDRAVGAGSQFSNAGSNIR
ncbi:MAG: TolC family protein [Desulfosalsimonadaceae bacterium]|nr:TolC family protein [Desulfosalsimonadaceae bacterium]